MIPTPPLTSSITLSAIMFGSSICSSVSVFSRNTPALMELAKSKETAVKAMKGLDDLMGSGDTDVGRIAQSIYARLDKATTATEIQAAGLEEQIDQVLDRSAIGGQLAKRKKKLGLSE